MPGQCIHLAPLRLAVLLVLLTTACGATVRSAAREAPREAVPVTIDEMLKAGEDPRTRERVARILATPELERAIAEVVRPAVAAGLEEATTGPSEERVAKIAESVGRALADHLRTDLVPAAIASARESLAESLSAEHMKAIKESLEAAIATAVRAAMRAAAEEIPSSVGPAVRTSLARELEDPELRKALGGLVDEATRRVLITSRDMLAEAQANQAASGELGPLAKARKFLTFSWGLAFAFGALGVALAAWLIRLRLRTKRYRLAVIELMTRIKRQGAASEGDDEVTERTARLLELLG